MTEPRPPSEVLLDAIRSSLDGPARDRFERTLEAAASAPEQGDDAVRSGLADAARLAAGGDPARFHRARLERALDLLEERARDRERPWLLVEGRAEGAEALLFPEAPHSIEGEEDVIFSRGFRLAGETARLRFDLLEALGASDLRAVAGVVGGGRRFLFLAPNDPERLGALDRAIAVTETRWLDRYGGALVPLVCWTAFGRRDLSDAASVRADLARAREEEARRPFRRAFAAGAQMGPREGLFPLAEEQRRLGEERRHGAAIRRARFAVLDRAWGLRPLDDLASLDRRPEGAVVFHGGAREAALQIVERAGGLGAAPELAPIVPVRPVRTRRSLAAVCVGVDDRAPLEGVPLVEALARRAVVDELLRQQAAGLAQGRRLLLPFSGGRGAIAMGAVRDLFHFVRRLQDLVAAADPGSALSVGVAVADPRPDRPAPVARLGRAARRERDRARAGGGGRLRAFGVDVPIEELAGALELAESILPLYRRSPAPVWALLEAALRLGEGGPDLTLASVERIVARAHEIVAKARVPNDVRRRLLSGAGALLRGGAARLPLAYAVRVAQEESR